MASRFPPAAAGVLMAIGGAEDKLGDKAVLARFVQLAGGSSARLLVVSTASSLSHEITDLYRTVLGELAGGLGLLPGVVVDQHFGQRNRIGRLLAMVAQSPALLGVGVDEDTAAVIGGDGVLEVIGRGAVTVVDGSNVVSDAYEVHQHRPVLVSGAVLHALPAGYRFDLAARKLLPRPATLDLDEHPRRSPRRLAKAIAAEGAEDRTQIGRAHV